LQAAVSAWKPAWLSTTGLRRDEKESDAKRRVVNSGY
jgi:hypothetical protein